MPQGPWDYLAGGTETETTLRRNRYALDTLALRPRVCRDVSRVDTGIELFGKRLELPLMLAPVGSVETFTAGGGATAARGAARSGVAQMLSCVCNPGLEAVAEASGDSLRLYQLYVRGDNRFIDAQVERALVHGYAAFAITVDTAHYSRRERDLDNRFVKPWRAAATGHDFQKRFNWDNVKHFKDKHRIPLILKGIMTVEDARIAVEHGVDGIYVSNHGGRQLDHGLGAMDVMPEVVKAVDGKAHVFVDGAFMRGTDVVKAMALGATAVGIGRLACLGLAADGEEGLASTLAILREEVRTAMGLLGVNRYDELSANFVTKAPAMHSPHVLSAFPLLER
ncbi:MAG: alpha-hydroxy-acid oxidizing protein [Gammaproteobacteria bacterium]|nr:alpha-hydroxy-acid oxidizing protein [Gammaproteobacteria bacterium]